MRTPRTIITFLRFKDFKLLVIHKFLGSLNTEYYFFSDVYPIRNPGVLCQSTVLLPGKRTSEGSGVVMGLQVGR